MEGQLLAILCSCLKEIVKRARLNTAATSCLPAGTGAGCSSPSRLSKRLGPASLLLSRKHAELFCSSAQLPGSTGDGHAAIRGLHWLAKPTCLCTVAWQHQHVIASVPWQAVLCETGAGNMVSSLAKPWSPLPFRLGAGASPAMPARYPAHTRMLNLVQLSWHPCGTYEVTVTTA